MTAAASARPRPPARRGQYLKALRKAHGWLGLWGALLGLLFGASGILQNHRAVLKIDLPGPVVETLQLQAPADLPRTDAAVGRWLQQALKLDKPAERIRKEAAQDVRWGDVTARQPERWQALVGRGPEFPSRQRHWRGLGAAIGHHRRRADRAVPDRRAALDRAGKAQADRAGHCVRFGDRVPGGRGAIVGLRRDQAEATMRVRASSSK
jgi:hypothetical protein